MQEESTNDWGNLQYTTVMDQLVSLLHYFLSFHCIPLEAWTFCIPKRAWNHSQHTLATDKRKVEQNIRNSFQCDIIQQQHTPLLLKGYKRSSNTSLTHLIKIRVTSRLLDCIRLYWTVQVVLLPGISFTAQFTLSCFYIIYYFIAF